MDLLPPPDEQPADVTWSVDLGVRTFLNRWLFNWRGERAVVEKELRELIERANMPGGNRGAVDKLDKAGAK